MVMNFLSEIKVEGSFKKITGQNQDLSPNRFYSQPKIHTHTHTICSVWGEFSEDFMNPTRQGPFPSLQAAGPNLLHLFHNTSLCGQSSGQCTRLCPAYSSQQCQPCSAAESDLSPSKLETESPGSLSWSLCWSQGMWKQSPLLDCPPEISFCELGPWALRLSDTLPKDLLLLCDLIHSSKSVKPKEGVVGTFNLKPVCQKQR